MTVSVGAMVRQLSGLVGTKDLSAWETNFVRDMDDRTHNGRQTAHLSGAQVEKVEEIWQKHCAG